MAIERAIYASIPAGAGVEPERNGYQYYTYSLGYQNLIKNVQGLEGRLCTAYSAPGTFVTEEWYNTTDHTDEDRNIASEKVFEEHPRAFAYWTIIVDGKEKSCFSYSKDMGHDWGNARFGTIFSSVVISDTFDISKSPVLYCSNPCVCCDIKRRDLFQGIRDNKKVNFLTSAENFEMKMDLPVQYSAGFDEITEDDIISFVREDGKAEILKSMLIALMKKKDGDDRCRIVIADQKENILLWITAISYLFPVRNVLDMSFCTYEHRPRYQEFDINGVYVAELNGIAVKSDEKDMVTWYRFQDACREYDAVYDFSQDYYAPNIEVPEHPFLRMAIQSLKLKRTEDIVKYKAFIENETTYNGLGTEYMSGYLLYLLIKKEDNLNVDQIKEAISFAEKYAKSELGEVLQTFFCKKYKKNQQDSTWIHIISEYNEKRISSGLESVGDIQGVYIRDFMEYYGRLNDKEYQDFLKTEETLEKICNLSTEELYNHIVTAVGIDQMECYVDETEISWKLIFILSVISTSIKGGEASFSRDSKVWHVVQKIMEKVGRNTPERIQNTMQLVIKKLERPSLCFDYIDASYIAFRQAGLIEAVEYSRRLVGDLFISSGIGSSEILSSIHREGAEEDYIQGIIEKICYVEDFEQKLTLLEVITKEDETDLNPYAENITRIAMKCVERLRNSLRKKSEIYIRIYRVIVKCEQRFGEEIKVDDIRLLMQGYIESLKIEHPDFIILDEELGDLWDLNNTYARISGDRNNNEVYMLLRIGELKECVDKPRKGDAFSSGNSEIKPVDFNKLDRDSQERYINTIGVLCGDYWIRSGTFPEHFFDLIYTSEESRKLQIYDDTLLSLLSRIINVDNDSSKVRKVADLLEMGIVYRRDGKLSKFLYQAIQIVTNRIKEKDIINILNKDREALEKESKKKNSNMVYTQKYLKRNDIPELVEMIEMIKAVYSNKKKGDQQEGIKGAILNLFGRK